LDKFGFVKKKLREKREEIEGKRMAAEEKVMNINVGVLGHVDSGKSTPRDTF
jgi:hypothetical protein